MVFSHLSSVTYISNILVPENVLQCTEEHFSIRCHIHNAKGIKWVTVQ